VHPSPITIVILIPTNSIIRVAIEQQTYVETNAVRETVLIAWEGFRGFGCFLKARPLYPNTNCRGTVPSRGYSMVLEKVRWPAARLSSGLKRAAELQIRMEELEKLEGRVDAVGVSIAEAVSKVLNPEPQR
jgi:hypothetical protein